MHNREAGGEGKEKTWGDVKKQKNVSFQKRGSAHYPARRSSFKRKQKAKKKNVPNHSDITGKQPKQEREGKGKPLEKC